jgi:hypothetical protein
MLAMLAALCYERYPLLDLEHVYFAIPGSFVKPHLFPAMLVAREGW